MSIVLWIFIPIWIIWSIGISYCIYMGNRVFKTNRSMLMDYAVKAVIFNLIIIIINLMAIILLRNIIMRALIIAIAYIILMCLVATNLWYMGKLVLDMRRGDVFAEIYDAVTIINIDKYFVPVSIVAFLWWWVVQ